MGAYHWRSFLSVGTVRSHNFVLREQNPWEVQRLPSTAAVSQNAASSVKKFGTPAPLVTKPLAEKVVDPNLASKNVAVLDPHGAAAEAQIKAKAAALGTLSGSAIGPVRQVGSGHMQSYKWLRHFFIPLRQALMRCTGIFC